MPMRAVLSFCFNPRPREGGDAVYVPPGTYKINGFNPRPREGGDADRLRARGGERVSIHAPARGATVGMSKP